MFNEAYSACHRPTFRTQWMQVMNWNEYSRKRLLFVISGAFAKQLPKTSSGFIASLLICLSVSIEKFLSL
jgi:hypothetical protein